MEPQQMPQQAHTQPWFMGLRSSLEVPFHGPDSGYHSTTSLSTDCSMTGYTTREAPAASRRVHGEDSSIPKRRVLRRRRVGERGPRGYFVHEDEGSSTRLRFARLQWTILMWLPILVLFYIVYAGNCSRTTIYTLSPSIAQMRSSCHLPYAIIILLGMIGGAVNDCGIGCNRFPWVSYIAAGILGFLMGMDFSLFQPREYVRLISITLFGIACGQLRYHRYRNRKYYPTHLLISGATALGEVLGCVLTHDAGLMYLIQAGLGYAMTLVAPIACYHILTRITLLIRLCFGSNQQLDATNYLMLAWWFISTVCSMGLLIVIAVYFIYWIVPFIFHHQLFLTPYACALEIASVEARRAQRSDTKYSDVAENYRQHITTILGVYGKH